MTDGATSNLLTVSQASAADFELLGRLLQLYLYDFSEHAGYDVDEHGCYQYAWLDSYRDDPDRYAYVLRMGDHPAGFALVRCGDSSSMAEFFVLRKYRRAGIGVRAVQQILRRHPGRWTVSQLGTNQPATVFWRRAIPVPFEESVQADGRVEQTFTIPAGADGSVREPGVRSKAPRPLP
ncbi:GNAT family N-acetyltransferase [Brachybacterium tyrofermentans]|uniref:GNAT family N-acetyltransferase n=1 Tax=Brachybacterium tyrofermentans TaxID=47848 RepID=UPI003FD53818